jgi:hypothetical protein
MPSLPARNGAATRQLNDVSGLNATPYRRRALCQ